MNIYIGDLNERLKIEIENSISLWTVTLQYTVCNTRIIVVIINIIIDSAAATKAIVVVVVRYYNATPFAACRFCWRNNYSVVITDFVTLVLLPSTDRFPKVDDKTGKNVRSS